MKQDNKVVAALSSNSQWRCDGGESLWFILGFFYSLGIPIGREEEDGDVFGRGICDSPKYCVGFQTCSGKAEALIW